MTTLIVDELAAANNNPLDTIEDIANTNDWVFERHGDEELTAAISGSYCEYQLRFFWRPEDSLLQVACVVDLRIPETKRPDIYEALGLINERIWVGHFEVWSEDGLLMFRHAVFVDDAARGLSSTHVGTLVETALAECERFYPVFQFIIWAGKSPKEAIEASMLDVAGEA